MNPINKIFTSAIISINKLIDSLNYKTVEAIKKGFFFFVFVMCIAGIIIGYRIGSGEAKIQRSPLTDYVNDTFRLNINKTGDFSELLKNEMLNEAPMDNFNKYDFPLRENFNPEFKQGIMESDNRIPDPDLTDKPFKPETPIEDSPKFDQSQSDQTIKILDKPKSDDTKSDDTKTNDIKINDNKSNSIFNDDQPFNKPDIKESDDKNIIRILDKDKNTIPQPMKNDTGIIDR
ncbi:MAG: hypothetical protein FWH53_03155 [Leptospirales bacterium]|nr:hypothetical protein [Leptospirales bacterium]